MFSGEQFVFLPFPIDTPLKDLQDGSLKVNRLNIHVTLNSCSVTHNHGQKLSLDMEILHEKIQNQNPNLLLAEVGLQSFG